VRWPDLRALGLLLLFLIVGCRPTAEAPTPTFIPTPIVPEQPTYVVQRGTVVRRLQFTGRVAPVREEKLFFRTGGYLQALHVQKGDSVRAGDLLAELETGDLEKQLAQARLDLEAAQLALESARRDNARQVAEAEIALRIAELRLAQMQADPPTAQVTTAKVALERAETALADAQDAYRRALDRPWEPEQVREAAARAVHEAELNLEIAQAQYQQAQQTLQKHRYAVQIQEQEVALARLRLESLQAGVDPQLSKAVEQARLKVERLEAQLADARLVAPFDGQVMAIAAAPGQTVEAFKPVIILADPTALEVVANLSADQMSDLKEGMPVTITLTNAPGQPLTGSIRSLPYPYGGGGGEGLTGADTATRIALTTPPAELQLGDLARVTVLLERRENVLWLPPAAIRTYQGRTFVVVKEGNLQRRVDVRLGIEGEDRVEIVSGLQEGQIVVGP